MPPSRQFAGTNPTAWWRVGVCAGGLAGNVGRGALWPHSPAVVLHLATDPPDVLRDGWVQAKAMSPWSEIVKKKTAQAEEAAAAAAAAAPSGPAAGAAGEGKKEAKKATPGDLPSYARASAAATAPSAAAAAKTAPAAVPASGAPLRPNLIPIPSDSRRPHRYPRRFALTPYWLPPQHTVPVTSPLCPRTPPPARSL